MVHLPPLMHVIPDTQGPGSANLAPHMHRGTTCEVMAASDWVGVLITVGCGFTTMTLVQEDSQTCSWMHSSTGI